MSVQFKRGATAYLPLSGGALSGTLTFADGGSYSPSTLRLASATSFGWNGDVLLYRNAANAIDMRNGSNAQALYLYNTYTDGSNNEQGGIRWNSNVFCVGHFSSPGSGSNRATQIYSGGGVAVTFNTGAGVQGDAAFLGKITTLASAIGKAGFNLPSGTAPTTPVDGDLWYDGTGLKVRIAGVTKTVTVS